MLANELIAKNLRMTNRKLEEFRNITFEHYDNHLTVKAGDSCVYFAYSKSISKPFLDKPSEGIFQINLDRTKKNDILLNLLHSVYVKSKCIDLASLCLKFNQEVFCISIDIYPICADSDISRLCIEGINEIIKIFELKTYFIPKIFQYCSIDGNIVSDPDEFESKESRWSAYVVMKSTREMLLVEKAGEGIDSIDLFNIIERAYSDIKEQNEMLI